MSLPALVLLPGLDGTGRLFDRLQEELIGSGRGISCDPVSFPTDVALSYQELADRIVDGGLPRGPLVLVAESFSGPLALMRAQRLPGTVAGLVLAASFVTPPLVAPRLLAMLSGPWAFRPFLVGSAIRPLLVGWSAPAALVEDVKQAVKTVETAVLAQRLRQLMQTDVSSLFVECGLPMYYIHASHDRLLGRRALQQIQNLRPDLSVHVVDAPHLVLQTEPRDCAKAILEFLRTSGFESTATPGDQVQ